MNDSTIATISILSILAISLVIMETRAYICKKKRDKRNKKGDCLEFL